MFNNFFASYESSKPLIVDEGTEEVQRMYERFMSSDLNFEWYNMLLPSNSPFKILTEAPKQEYDFLEIRIPELPKQLKVLKGSEEFEKAFEEATKINPEVNLYKNFLVKTAKRESGFNSSILNTAGAPYYGYFLMGKDEIRKTTGLSVDEFRNNPVLQILGAVKLYKLNMKVMKAIGAYKMGKDKGYSDDALMTGAWMGGPGGVKKYLSGQGDPSDSHWYGGLGGSSVGKVMNNWKNYE